MAIATDESYKEAVNLHRKLRQFQAFDAELVANEGRIEQLCTKGNELVDQGHFDSDNITRRVDALRDEWKDLRAQSVTKGALALSRFPFVHTALAASPPPPPMPEHGLASLQPLHRHRCQSAGLPRHSPAHIALPPLASFCSHPPATAGRLLNEASEVYDYNRRVDEVVAALEKAEAFVALNALGEDVAGAEALLKKQTDAEAELHGLTALVDGLKARSDQFVQRGVFDADGCRERFLGVSEHYADIQEPFRARRVNLEASLELQRLLLEMKDEAAWLTMKMPVVESTDYGGTLSAAKILGIRWEAFELEMATRETRIGAVSAFAERLLSEGHYAAATITERLESLMDLWARLKDAAELRAKLLEESRDIQFFLVDVAELTSALQEKAPAVASDAYGDTVDASATLLSKHGTLMADLLAFEPTVQELRGGCQDLVEAGVHSHERVQAAQDGLEGLFAELQAQGATRHKALEEAVQMHTFTLEQQECLAWLEKSLEVASSTDHGEDVELCEVEVKKFEDFASDTKGGQERVDRVRSMAEAMVSAKHASAKALQNAADDVVQRWDTLAEAVESRRAALANALSIHAFHRDADETMEWISQKEEVSAVASEADKWKDRLELLPGSRLGPASQPAPHKHEHPAPPPRRNWPCRSSAPTWTARTPCSASIWAWSGTWRRSGGSWRRSSAKPAAWWPCTQRTRSPSRRSRRRWPRGGKRCKRRWSRERRS